MRRSRVGGAFFASTSSGGRKSGSLAGLVGEGTGEKESFEELGEPGGGDSIAMN